MVILGFERCGILGEIEKTPPKSPGRAFFMCTDSVNIYRVSIPLSYMLLNRPNGHLFPVEDTGGQGRLCLGLLKYRREVSDLILSLAILILLFLYFSCYFLGF